MADRSIKLMQMKVPQFVWNRVNIKRKGFQMPKIKQVNVDSMLNDVIAAYSK